MTHKQQVRQKPIQTLQLLTTT